MTAQNAIHRYLPIAIVAAAVGALIAGVSVWLIMASFNAAHEEAPPGGMGMDGPPPAPVRVGEVNEQVLADRFDVVGRLQEVRRATVASEVEGKVLEAPIEAGDQVTAGQTVLAKIDDAWAKLALAQASADVVAAEAEVEQSKRDLEYLTTLANRGSAKPKEVEDARTTLASDQAKLDAMIAERDRVQLRIERLDILAPFDGVVLERLVEKGQWVTPGAAVANIITTGDIDAEVYAPESHLAALEIGQSIEVTIDALGERVAGKLTLIVPDAANAARTFPVKIRIDDQGGRFKAGMSVVAHLPLTNESSRLTVPRDAVFFKGDEATVWVAVEGDPMPKAFPVAVSVPFAVADRYVVEPFEGQTLEPGARVVTQGGERLMPQQPLQINEEATQAAR